MPTLMQKIRLAIRGWSRRREEKQQEFLKQNVWAPASAGTGGLKPASTQKGIDIDGLTVAYLDDSGQFHHYFDLETGEVIDTREPLSGDRYRRVPSRNAQSEIDDRRRFIATLDDSGARARLASVPPESFRSELSGDRALERAWYNFKNDRAIAVIEAWLREMGMR